MLKLATKRWWLLVASRNGLISDDLFSFNFREIYVGDIILNSGEVNSNADRQLVGTEFDGIIGAFFLRNYNLILDYPHAQIILEPRKSR